MKGKCLSLVLALWIVAVAAVHDPTQSVSSEDQAECPDLCDPDSCPVPDKQCLAGLVKDHCDCCFACGRREGERCFDEQFKDQLPEDYPRYSKCGDDLECRLRDDLEPDDRLEAVCYCTKNEPICGSDGITYENQCQFTEARYKNRKLFEVDNQPCRSRPTITAPPEDTTNNTGSMAAFACEAQGYPLPAIEWRFETDNGNETVLSADGQHFDIKWNEISDYLIIGWLQIMNAQRNHSGTYVCVANNTEGEDRATAYLTIGNFQKTFDLPEE